MKTLRNLLTAAVAATVLSLPVAGLMSAESGLMGAASQTLADPGWNRAVLAEGESEVADPGWNLLPEEPAGDPGWNNPPAEPLDPGWNVTPTQDPGWN
ncbi:hypothetical protein HHL19_35885 [Streptomyces sp. R302]|uniref:hypothetical protein n=1 Tax=unclassified Streptomyces TaxID=2593676 RepID=UPI00145CE851|nr:MULTISPECIES: hypothetical protein [unclassified Streptomyces]NML55078.1 hypothetical protein [Streptomyces sp. R301]NML83892.1 hypothetical protein [Streptomyces sp. R302]